MHRPGNPYSRRRERIEEILVMSGLYCLHHCLWHVHRKCFERKCCTVLLCVKMERNFVGLGGREDITDTRSGFVGINNTVMSVA